MVRVASRRRSLITMKIIDKIRAEEASRLGPFFSYEFFPPKTDAGVENLYLRMERMTSMNPIFVDVTWGAGGSTRDLTMAISAYTQTYFGTDALMHLTCTGLTIEDIKQILLVAREKGIKNILALRGDPPKGAIAWDAPPGGLTHAVDLVRLIRAEHGDYFGIAVAGFPEGHPASFPNRGTGSPISSYMAKDQSLLEADILHLREKIQAGADFVLTQFFYDSDVFVDYTKRCRAAGITCPIIPGMMPIQSFSQFQKMTSFCRTKVPACIWDALAKIKDDDEAVKAYGVAYCTEMCKVLFAAGTPGFHFYTLNLEKSVLSVLEELGVREHTAARRALPWRGSRQNLRQDAQSTSSGDEKLLRGGNSTRGGEEVRPINWANRPKSYIKRTVTWDEFPNGRWGDGRSPAFGELSDSHFFRPVEGSKEDRLAMWGEAPITGKDVGEVFARYVEGKIPILPWCESIPQTETKVISGPLASINRAGFWTINSQPAVNGERSDHAVYGWGGAGGRVYQRAYIEFFTSPERLAVLRESILDFPALQVRLVFVYTSNMHIYKDS